MEHKVSAYVRLNCDIYLQVTPKAIEQGFSLNYYLKHSKLEQNLKRELDKFADNFSSVNFKLKLETPVKPSVAVSELQYSFWADGYLDLQEPLFTPHKEIKGFEVHFKDYCSTDEIRFLLKEAVKTAVFASNETLISYVDKYTPGISNCGQAQFLKDGKEILELDKIGHICTEITEEDVAIGSVFENPGSLSAFSANDIEALQEWFEIYAKDPEVSNEDKIVVYLGLAAGLPDFQVPEVMESIIPGFDKLRRDIADIQILLKEHFDEDKTSHDLDLGEDDDYDRF